MSSPTHSHAAADGGEAKVSNFLRQIIEKDLEQGTYASRRWAGNPGDAAHQFSARTQRLPARGPRQEYLPELWPGA
mgnify:CR=1 FL=1